MNSEPPRLERNAVLSLTGMSEHDARLRLVAEGYNELPQSERRTLLRIVIEVLRDPMPQLLLAAGLIYLVIGSAGEAAMLLGFVVLSLGITIVQERRTEGVLEALRDLTSPRALVIREGERRRIAGREVVRGDLIVLAEGDWVPADARLVLAADLQTDESLLTGEPVPAVKVAAGKVAATDAGVIGRPGGDGLPFVYSGSMVVRGQGVAEVVATGARSEIGKIGKSLGEIDDEATPLRAQVRRMVKLFSVIGLALSSVVVLIYGFARGEWLNGVLAGITLAMSMLPQEFPLILTVFMAMGAWRISRQRVLTRRSAAIEALGSATLLCSDKTGTLTMNRMSVAELSAGEQTWTAEDAAFPEAFHALVEFGILASETDPFDPMEKAFHELGAKHLSNTEHLHARWVIAHEYNLGPDLLAMTHVWRAAEGGSYVIAAKGAPEAIADLCHLDASCLSDVLSAAEGMAARGLRVLGVARSSFEGGDWPGSQHDFEFEFLGLVALADPLRPGVAEAMRECRSAGIQVTMITGDYPATALAIAAQAGIDTSGGVLAGDELQAMDEAALRERIAGVRVFARIMPEQKLRIVNAFKARGDVVAMTGDGVNDAPSLKAAHIGIAMGGRGTDVAREAAAIVLLDDDFGSIVRAVRLGRRIYDNLLKAMAFVLAVHVPIAGLSLLPLLFGLPVIFMPVHIAFLELVIDPVCSIAFEAEPEEGDLMQRPPRSRDAALFSLPMIAASVLQGVCVLIAAGGLFLVLLDGGMAEDGARAACFIALVAGNVGLILFNRAFDANILSVLRRPNPALWGMLAATCVLLAAAVLIPPLRDLFHFKAIPAATAGLAVLVGLAVLPVLALMRRVFGRRA